MRQFPVSIKANAIEETMTMAKAEVAPAMTQTRPPWNSPVPYIFGGLAAMLGLIAFALLLLACSYWKLSDGGDGDGGGVKDSDEKTSTGKVYVEEILVIMAGEEKPTFLATPVAIAIATATAAAGGGIVNTEGDEGQNGESTTEEPSHEGNH